MRKTLFLLIAPFLLAQSVRALDLAKDLSSANRTVRQAALNKLSALDSASKKKLIADLDSLIEKKEPANYLIVFEALSRLAPESFPVLVKGLKNPDYKIRSYVADELG